MAASAIAERKNLIPADYARRLSDEKQRLSHFKEVDVALTVSCEMLGEERFALWRTLAVFPSTFDDSAASAVWEMEADAAKDTLGDLLAFSLVEYDEESGRYSLHDLARIFADGRLSESERDLAQRRHALHYAHELEQANKSYRQGGKVLVRGLALFDKERENIEAGWAWAAAAAERDHYASVLCMYYPSADFLHLRQRPREQIRWLEVMLGPARSFRERGYECCALSSLGIAYAELGETRKSVEYFEQVLAIGREMGDQLCEGAALNNLGVAYGRLGESHKAIEYHEQNLAITRGIDRRGEGHALCNLGCEYSKLGETRKAIEYLEQALAIGRELGDRESEGMALANLGNAYDDMGETTRAFEYYEQALAIEREIGALRDEGSSLWNMSLSLYQLGERKRALANAEAALRIYEEIESPYAERVRRRLAEWRAAPQQ